MKYKMLIFDLDGTLLRSDKTVSEYTLEILKKCRNMGYLLGISTSRSEFNSARFISQLCPDAVISSGGATVSFKDEYIFKAEFSGSETAEFIARARDICGKDTEISIDTEDGHYWNFKVHPAKADSSWGDSTYCDFENFNENSLKICVECGIYGHILKLVESFPDCDAARYSGGDWYKFTKKSATKANAILLLCNACGICAQEIIAFGDDYADIEMLKICGLGVAPDNAIQEVKKIADVIVGDNDSDGIAKYIEKELLVF